MIPLGPGDTLQALASTASKLSAVFAYVDVATNAVDVAAGSGAGYLPAAAATQLTAGASGALVRAIQICNTDVVARDVTLYVNGNTDAQRIVKATLGAGYTLVHNDNGWQVLNASGVIQVTAGSGGGLADGDYGDITVSGTGTVLTVDAATITLAKMANLAANSIIGNNTGAPATPLALTAAQVKTLLAIAQADVSGLTTADSPQLAGVNVGHASDTTLARASAGDLSVEGNRLFRVGGADVPVADGGTGASTPSAARQNLGISTARANSASLAGSAAGDVALSWDVAFANTNYSIGGTAGYNDATNRNPPNHGKRDETKAAAGITIRVLNNAAVNEVVRVEAIAVAD